MSEWQDRTAIVTGAASGIGRALSAALTRRGAFVVGVDIDGPGAAEVARAGESALGLALDVRDGAAFEAVVADVVKERGRLDFLFNNAGVGAKGEALELKREHWDFVFGVNVGGTVNGILAAYPRMVQQRSGHIVNTASLAGLGVAPFLAPYAASKHAVVGLSTTLRVEAAMHGVRVSVLCPSAIETPLLDKEPTGDLPPVSWKPNVRRFLTRLGGPPYPVLAFVDEALEAIAQNKGVIVIPAAARLRWRIGRVFPWLVERIVTRAAREERQQGP